MTLYKRTDKPKESGWYIMSDNNGDMENCYFDAGKNTWDFNEIRVDCAFWYSPEPPAELAEVLENIKISLNNAAHDFSTEASIHVDVLQTLLTHLTTFTNL